MATLTGLMGAYGKLVSLYVTAGSLGLHDVRTQVLVYTCRVYWVKTLFEFRMRKSVLFARTGYGFIDPQALGGKVLATVSCDATQYPFESKAHVGVAGALNAPAALRVLNAELPVALTAS